MIEKSGRPCYLESLYAVRLISLQQMKCALVSSLYPLQNVVLGGYTVFSMSVIPKFRHSKIPSTFKVFTL